MNILEFSLTWYVLLGGEKKPGAVDEDYEGRGSWRPKEQLYTSVASAT